jgi:hypothetical protein
MQAKCAAAAPRLMTPAAKGRDVGLQWRFDGWRVARTAQSFGKRKRDDLSQAVHMGGEARRSLCVYRCPSCQVTALTSELPPLAGWVKSNTSTPNAGRSVRHASDCQVGALLELFEDILGPDAVQAVGQACRAKWAECVEQLCAVVGRI